MDLIINYAVKLVITIMVVAVGTYAIPWLKTNLDYKKLSIVYSYASTFVNAAEQLFEHGDNEEKLSYVSELLEKALKRIGIKLSKDDIRATIEDAVKELK